MLDFLLCLTNKADRAALCDSLRAPCLRLSESRGDRVLPVLAGGHGEQQLLVEGFLQQLQQLPALLVVGQVSADLPTCVRLAWMRVFLLRVGKKRKKETRFLIPEREREGTLFTSINHSMESFYEQSCLLRAGEPEIQDWPLEREGLLRVSAASHPAQETRD